MKICTACNRTYLDDTFKYCSGDGQFLSVSYEPEMDSLIRTHPFLRTFNTSSLVISNVEESVVAINLADQYPYARDADELYNCTRGFWRVKRESAEKAHYAFAIYQGVIKEVYEIDGWVPAEVETGSISFKNLNAQRANSDTTVNFGWYQFVGKIAPQSVRNKYIERQIPVAHGQSPILYFNC